MFGIAFVCLFTFAIIRFGLLTATIALFVARIGAATPFTLHATHWSAAASNWTIVLVGGLAVFGFYASRGGRFEMWNLGVDG